jgi:hypothetical protein
VDLKDVSWVGPLLYGAAVVLLGKAAESLIAAFNQRIKDRDAYRKQQHDDSASITLRRIDDAARWREQQEARIVILDKENAEKDLRIDTLVELAAQLRSEKTALERERDWYKERCAALGQELNELKYKRREP